LIFFDFLFILNKSFVIQIRSTMAIDITLTLPDNLIEHAKRFG